MTLLLTQYITSVNCFLVSLWSQSLFSSLHQHNMLFISWIMVPFREKKAIKQDMLQGMSLGSQADPIRVIITVGVHLPIRSGQLCGQSDCLCSHGSRWRNLMCIYSRYCTPWIMKSNRNVLFISSQVWFDVHHLSLFYFRSIDCKTQLEPSNKNSLEVNTKVEPESALASQVSAQRDRSRQ